MRFPAPIGPATILYLRFVDMTCPALSVPLGGPPTEPIYPGTMRELGAPFPTSVLSVSHIIAHTTSWGEFLFDGIGWAIRHPQAFGTHKTRRRMP